MMSISARVMVEQGVEGRTGRRRHSIAEKRRIVEATLAPDASVARVAREHGVNANLVFSRRRLYQRGLLGGNRSAEALVTVQVAESVSSAPEVPEVTMAASPSGSIQLRLPKGQLRIDGAVDPSVLRVVLESLLG
jgi:transposase